MGPIPVRSIGGAIQQTMPGRDAETAYDLVWTHESVRTRDIFFRHLVQGDDFATIGSSLDMTEGAARWTYNNALTHIRRRLRP